MDVINTLVEPWDYRGYRLEHGGQDPERLYFVCPTCGTEVDQHATNFHYWCPSCGQNAADTLAAQQQG